MAILVFCLSVHAYTNVSEQVEENNLLFIFGTSCYHFTSKNHQYHNHQNLDTK